MMFPCLFNVNLNKNSHFQSLIIIASLFLLLFISCEEVRDFSVHDGTLLNDDEWVSSYISIEENEWFSISVEAGQCYRFFWDDRFTNSVESDEGDVKVSIFKADRQTVLIAEKDDGYSSQIIYEALETEILFLRVTPVRSISSDAGMYRIKYRQIDLEWKSDQWTLMIYADADCNLEWDIMKNLEEIRDSLQSQSVNVIVLVDRHEDYMNAQSQGTNFCGYDFSDTRLYRIYPGYSGRLDGGESLPQIGLKTLYEGNMGSGELLSSFIQYCKTEFPANHYGLLMANHGTGSRSISRSDTQLSTTSNSILSSDMDDTRLGGRSSTRAICVDESDDDMLYCAEMTDSLSIEDSIDLLIFDACYMATAANAYQYSLVNGDFSSNFLVASPSVIAAAGLPYPAIFSSPLLESGSLSSLSAEDFGLLILNAYKEDVLDNEGPDTAAFSLLDLSKMGEVKVAMDQLAPLLKEKRDQALGYRGKTQKNQISLYFDPSDSSDQLFYPYCDLFELFRIFSLTPAFKADEIEAIHEKSALLAAAVDSAVVASFAHKSYFRFLENKSGLSFFLPDGKADYNNAGELSPIWAWCWWYVPFDSRWEAYNDDTIISEKALYGKIALLQNVDAVAENAVIESWFELMDYWFDDASIKEGNGYNGYQY